VLVSPHIRLSDAVYSVQREFILASDAFRTTPGVDQFCCIAGLIFVECFLRDVNPNAKIVELLNQRLRASISQLESAVQEESNASRSSLLLWGLIIGAVTSEHVNWHVQELAFLAQSLDVQSWGDMERRIREVVFPEAAYSAAKRFWEQVEESWQRSCSRYPEM
jgi:hypothetical protein